jgi:DNA polymerase-3 subunit epsilon
VIARSAAPRWTRRLPWREAALVALDVEATGLDPARDEVISFAAVPIEAGRIVASHAVYQVVRPRVASSPESIAIHGILPADVASAPAIGEVSDLLAAAVRGRVPIAHPAWVERMFLDPVLRPYRLRLGSTMLDTAMLHRLLCIERELPDPGTRSLGACAEQAGVPVEHPHHARGDALTCAQLFLALATHLETFGHGSVGALSAADRKVQAWNLLHPPR